MDRKLVATLLIASGVVLGGQACSASSGGGAPGGSSGTPIGAGGGSATATDGSGSSVTVPAGAVGSGSTVSVAITTASGAPQPAAEDGVVVGPTYLLAPEGQQFQAPVTLTIAFDPTRVPSGSSASDVAIFTSPATGAPEYVPLPTTVADATHVTAQTTHFSYAVAVAHRHAAADAGGADAAASDATSPVDAGAFDGTTSSDAPGAGDATLDASGDTSLADASADTTLADAGADGSDGADLDSGFACVVPPNPAPAVNDAFMCGFAPTPTGGTIVDGTYYLVSNVRYAQGDAGCGGTPGQAQSTVVVAGTSISLNDVQAWYVGPYSTSGTDITFGANCSDGGFPNTTIGYSATATSLTLFIPCGGCTPVVGMNVGQFTKQ